MLAEFASVVDAMRCTVEDQRSMAERNSEVPREKRIGVRLGIHQGDIWLDGYARDASVAAFTRQQQHVPDHSADRPIGVTPPFSGRKVITGPIATVATHKHWQSHLRLLR